MARLKTVTARSEDEVEALRPSWERLQGAALPADVDYFLAVSRSHPAVKRPHVVVVEREGEPVTIVAGHLTETWVLHRIGPWDVYKPKLSAINVAYRGVLGDRSPETVGAAMAELRSALDDREAQTVLLRYIEPGGLLHETALASTPVHRREHFVPLRAHWSVTLGDSLEETLGRRSAKTRENIRRVTRRMQQVFGDRLRLRVYRDPAAAPELFATIDDVAVKSYQYGHRALFSGSELERELTLLGLQKGWYRAYVLSVDEQPVAFWTGFAYGGTFGWRGATAYDPAYRAYSPGMYVLAQLLDDVSSDDTISVFDLGGGDVAYKRYFADHRWEELDVRLLGPGLRPLAVNAIGSSVQTLHLGIGRAAAAVGISATANQLQLRRMKQQTVLGVNSLPRL